MENPVFVDNRDGNTLARALGDALGASDAAPDELRIATGFFSPSGFARIADGLRTVRDVRLLIGVDLGAETSSGRRNLGETDAAFERRRLRLELRQADEALWDERDRMPFSRASAAALRHLVAGLTAGNIAVRRYERGFMHAKAYILGGEPDGAAEPRGVLAGSSNLTVAGLTSNLELNLGRYDTPVVARARQWFDELWEEAEDYDLAIAFDDALRPRTPWEIFIRVLWQLYGDEVEEDARADGNLPLTSFQKHGVARALRLIRDTGGVIVADEVGLGKTYIAGEILQVYRDRRQRALLICPASVRDNVWKTFQNQFEFYVECLSFEQLAQDKQLKDKQRPNATSQHLSRPVEEYQLVVVDEAHNYRNPDAPTRAAALRKLLYGAPRDVVLLTATPVNNSLWDLYHLLRFFVRQDAYFANKGILSIKERFDSAMAEDPTSLSPDRLFPIIDATTVKRTRQFVRKHYGRDTIVGPDGTPLPIVFPRPVAMTVRYGLDERMPGLFDQVEAALDPERTDCLSFARYMPGRFLVDPDERSEAVRHETSDGLLRSGLLKRFESSTFAFGRTVSKMSGEHEAFLEALDEGYVVNTAFMQELSGDDEAVFEDLLRQTANRRDASRFDVEGLRAAVELDSGILGALADAASAVSPRDDPKLDKLADILEDVAAQAEREAVGADDERQKRKILVFSYFEDTVEWIRDFLERIVAERAELAAYDGRIVAVGGSGTLAEVARREAAHGFAPVSMEAPAGRDADRFDLMVTTDVLAEGVNLQQCGNIVNFDLPWNPMRLVQRHGRIDRIGSPHDNVCLRTIFPAEELDRLLNLEQRILDKLALAAAAVGVVAPVEGARGGSQVFTETRDEIEKLLSEDTTLYERGGTAGAAQTGEEYRQTLRKELETNRDAIVNLPRKVGSGMARGSRRGVFFCAAVGERTYLRFVPADDEWGVAPEEEMVRETGSCLRTIECEPDTATWFPESLQDCAYDFWDAARQDILEAWMVETDPANLQPKVRPLNHRVADYIRTNEPAGVPQERIERALDILESPWPRREEIMLRDWFESRARSGAEPSQTGRGGVASDPGARPVGKTVRFMSDRGEGAANSDPAEFLVEQILGTGLEPVQPPEPLPPIADADVELICWLGVEATIAATDG